MRNLIKKAWANEFVRYSVVGVGRWIVGTAIMFVLYNYFGCGYWLSSACNNIFSNLILGYVLGYLIVFPGQKPSVRSAAEYALLAVSCYLIAYSLAPLLVQPMEEHIANWAAAHLGKKYGELLQGNITLVVGTVLHMGLNYIGQRFIVFPKKKKQTNE